MPSRDYPVTRASRAQSDHSGERSRPKCAVCDREFSTPRALERHMRLHTGEAPFTCQLCKKQFLLAEGLTRHCRTHTGERLFECAICHLKFARMSELNMHLDSRHPVLRIENVDNV